MLSFTVVLRPQRAEALCQRLLQAGWVDELVAAECRGYGRQKGHLDQYADEYRIDFLPKVLVAGTIDDDHREAFLDLVQTTARTGRIGDGKIFLTPIERVVEY